MPEISNGANNLGLRNILVVEYSRRLKGRVESRTSECSGSAAKLSVMIFRYAGIRSKTSRVCRKLGEDSCASDADKLMHASKNAAQQNLMFAIQESCIINLTLIHTIALLQLIKVVQ